MEPRDIAISQARGRIAIGVALVAAPGLAVRGWIGDDASRPATKVVTRALGAREVAIGLGIVIAIDRGAPCAAGSRPRRWPTALTRSPP